MYKKWIVAALCVAAGSTSAFAEEEGNWMVRGRILHLNADNKNSHSATQVVTSGDRLEAENKTFPEIDFSYFFTKNIAAELILTYPQKHDVELDGFKIGTLKHLPPVLTLQYHFMPEGTIRPYVGIGINYTRFSSIKINAIRHPGVAVDTKVDMDRNSWGLAGQIGVDFKIAPKWFLNLDAKYVKIEAEDVRIKGPNLAGVKVTDLKVDPWLLSVGVGYRF